jgi:hypothetical protein
VSVARVWSVGQMRERDVRTLLSYRFDFFGGCSPHAIRDVDVQNGDKDAGNNAEGDGQAA